MKSVYSLPIKVGVIEEKVIELLHLSIKPDTPILLGESNIEHMKASHPEEYKKYSSFICDILMNPDFINLNPKDQSIKYLKKIEEYVIVGVRVSNQGKAYARTLFVFSTNKFNRYLTDGYLIPYK